ncbi:MAG: hypothetical protein DI628_00735 [Blastochloris viridis]|uniref:Uncharacterized protein n=1 Tax=Blastochloris viridis TaxID=1079 RepID=A0A6N4RD14_BLAVI|nr:MAG: hypothetical protein DI628_00735 [Blastochloris viridis]
MTPVFTPLGPWTYCRHEEGCPVVGPQGRICDLDCTTYPDGATDEEMQLLDAQRDAFGCLIAALPEMVEACRSLCQWADTQSPSIGAPRALLKAIAMAAIAMNKIQSGDDI